MADGASEVRSSAFRLDESLRWTLPTTAASHDMSLDIDWSLLSDSDLTEGIVDAFNKYLANADRPSYLGPISVTSFDFGTQPPDVEVVGLNDVYPDFLAEDEEERGSEEDDGEGSHYARGEDGYSVAGWQDGLSSAAGGRAHSRDWPLASQGGLNLHGEGYFAQQHAMDDSFSVAGRARSSISALPTTARAPFSSPVLNRPYLAGIYNHHSPFPSRVGLGSALPTPMTTPFLSRNPSFSSIPQVPPSRGGTPSSHLGGHEFLSQTPDEHPLPPKPSKSGPPSLQLHLRIQHQADIRFSLQTTLLVNHPSPAFMSLPLTLTITQVELDLHLVIAYQAEDEPPIPPSASRSPTPSGRRVHISILDPLDPYGPPAPGASTPPPAPHLGESKIPPAGERLISHMSMESSIGQEGDRVLRNVAKVERCVRISSSSFE